MILTFLPRLSWQVLALLSALIITSFSLSVVSATVLRLLSCVVGFTESLGAGVPFLLTALLAPLGRSCPAVSWMWEAKGVEELFCVGMTLLGPFHSVVMAMARSFNRATLAPFIPSFSWIIAVFVVTLVLCFTVGYVITLGAELLALLVALLSPLGKTRPAVPRERGALGVEELFLVVVTLLAPCNLTRGKK